MNLTEFNTLKSVHDYQYDKKTGETKGYDEDKNLVYEGYDSDLNGINEMAKYYNKDNTTKVSTFDNDTGNVISEVYFKDDKMLNRTSYTYNSAGKLTLQEIDSDADGVVDITNDYRNVFEKLGDFLVVYLIKST